MTDRRDIDRRNDALLGWYDSHRRALPWRDTGDPYATLVSEAMLQQTQVTRVIDRYVAFVDRWPDPEALAEATNDEVLTAWSGLGYNSRAIRLRDAARRIVDGGWPTTVEGLRDLPGVGPYTAAAIASMAFGEPVAAVDTNLRRILSRWVGEPLAGSELDSVAAQLVALPAGDWNQALMDLGSDVCRPTTPDCERCPVVDWCADPTVYEPPPRQAAFAGSRRELRGALVRAHLAQADLVEAGRELGRSDEEIAAVVVELRTEGLLPASLTLDRRSRGASEPAGPQAPSS